MPYSQEAKLPQNIPSHPENYWSKPCSMRKKDCKGQSREQLPRSTDTMELQDKPISPGSRVRSGSRGELISQTPGQPSMKIISTGGATHSAAGQQVYDHAKRAASPTGSASQGPPNTPVEEDEAADALNDAVGHATQLRVSLSKLAVPARNSQICSESSDASSLRAFPKSTGTTNADRAILQLQGRPGNTCPRISGSQLSPISILDRPSHMQAVAAGAACGHSQAGELNIHQSTDRRRPIPDLLGQQQKLEVITAAAAIEETPSNKRDSTKSFLTMSSIFDYISEDTAITADEESQDVAFSHAFSMDDMEGWEVVRVDI